LSNRQFCSTLSLIWNLRKKVQRLGMLIKSKHNYNVTFLCTCILSALHSIFFYLIAPLFYYRLSGPLHYRSIVYVE
jgi:hypothetical protein